MLYAKSHAGFIYARCLLDCVNGVLLADARIHSLVCMYVGVASWSASLAPQSRFCDQQPPLSINPIS